MRKSALATTMKLICVGCVFSALPVNFLSAQEPTVSPTVATNVATNLEQDGIVKFHSGRFGIAFSYPSKYKKIENEDLQKIAGNVPILIAAKAQNSSDSFNLLANVGSYDIKQTVTKLANLVIKDYKAIGITSVAASAPQKIRTEVGEVFNTDLFYTNADQEMFSNVSIIPAGTKHYILTFISADSNQQDTIRAEVKQLLKTLSFSNNTQASQPTLEENVSEEPEEHSNNNTIPYLIALIILGFVAVFNSDKKTTGQDNSKKQ